jgi:hypothetical protein
VFLQLAYECRQVPQIREVKYEQYSRQDAPAYVMSAAREFYGIYDVLCVHLDADGLSDRKFRNDKVNPAMRAVAEAEGDIIRVIAPLVPVRTVENWMLADRDALLKLMGTRLSARELDLHHPPESYPKPKETIKDAIRKHEAQKSGRRKKVTIRDFYEPLGENASLEELQKLPSFQKFYAAARQSLIDLGLIVPE